MATLKVRVRLATGGPTLKVQLPPLCSLQALKDAIASQSGQSASSFNVSLNKKDAIDGPCNALLSSFGVINGDLLFYIPSTGDSGHPPVVLNSAPASITISRNLTPQSTSTSISSGDLESPGNTALKAREGCQGSSSGGQERSVDPVSLRRELFAAAALQRTSISQSARDSPESDASPSELSNRFTRSASGDFASCSSLEERIKQKGKFKVDCSMDASGSGSDAMEMETEEEGTGPLESPNLQKMQSSLPDLLQRVLLVEYEKVKERQAVLVLAIHAVMLETGFVLQQPVGVVGSSDGCGLPPGWSGKGGLVNLTYTLPEIIRAMSLGVQTSSVGDAILRCQVIGNALVVYGAVTGGQGSEIYRLSLPVSQYLHKDLVVEDSGNAGDALKVLADVSEGGKQDAIPMDCQATEKHLAFESTVNMFCNVFELWQRVKDYLSLPLLTCMCEKAGLQPPASLLMLPTELKIKVLENLPAASLATIGCVCSELKFLATSDELWKVRFKEEFWPEVDRAPGGRGWKTAYARELARRKRREEERREAERQLRAEAFPALIMRPPPLSPHFPGVLGGDYDRFPGLGGSVGFRPRGPGGAFWSANFPAGGIGEPDRLVIPNLTGGRRACEIPGLGREFSPSLNMMGGTAGDDNLDSSLFGRDLGAHPPGNL